MKGGLDVSVAAELLAAIKPRGRHVFSATLLVLHSGTCQQIQTLHRGTKAQNRGGHFLAPGLAPLALTDGLDALLTDFAVSYWDSG